MAEFGGVKPLVSPSYKGSPAPELWPPYCRGRQRAQCPSHRDVTRDKASRNARQRQPRYITSDCLHPPSPSLLFPSPCLTGPLLTLYTIYNLSAPKPFSLRRTCVFGSAFILEPVPVQVDVHDRATAHKVIGGRWNRKCPDSFRPRQRLGHIAYTLPTEYPGTLVLVTFPINSSDILQPPTVLHGVGQRAPTRTTISQQGDTQFDHRWITLSYVRPH